MIESERIVKRKDYENGRISQSYVCDLIRCKDCKHWDYDDETKEGDCNFLKIHQNIPNWFCASGKHK